MSEFGNERKASRRTERSACLGDLQLFDYEEEYEYDKRPSRALGNACSLELLLFRNLNLTWSLALGIWKFSEGAR